MAPTLGGHEDLTSEVQAQTAESAAEGTQGGAQGSRTPRFMGPGILACLGPLGPGSHPLHARPRPLLVRSSTAGAGERFKGKTTEERENAFSLLMAYAQR